MISQNLILNKILNTKDLSIVISNNLSDKYFFNYKNEFNFILNHYKVYSVIPDKSTFAVNFPDFEFQVSTEPDNFLLEQLYKDYNTSYLATRFNNIKKMLENDQTDEAVKYFLDSSENLQQNKPLTCTDILHNTKERYDAYIDKCNNFTKYYIGTGLEALDAIIGGWDRHEEYAIVTARPGVGKSYISLKFALAAAEQGLNVGYYAGEMTALKMGYRADTLFGHVSNGALTHGNLGVSYEYAEHLKRLELVSGKINVLTPNDVAGPVDVATFRAFIENYKLDILFIDQISLVDDIKHGKTLYEKVANISRDLKKLQVSTQIPIIAVSQLNRTKNEDGTQDLTQIAGSDNLGQDATICLFLDVDKQDKELLKVNLVKNRDGMNGVILDYKVNFNTGTWTFVPNEATQTTTEQADDEFDPYAVE